MNSGESLEEENKMPIINSRPLVKELVFSSIYFIIINHQNKKALLKIYAHNIDE